MALRRGSGSLDSHFPYSNMARVRPRRMRTMSEALAPSRMVGREARLRCATPWQHYCGELGRKSRRSPEAKPDGGPGRICTFEGVSHQIYSLARLTTSVPTHGKKPRKCTVRHARMQRSDPPERPLRREEQCYNAATENDPNRWAGLCLLLGPMLGDAGFLA